MYCPKCLNNSLCLASHGVVDIVINGKQMDAGRFLYNLERETKDEIAENLKYKIEDFFKWYTGFQNREPLSYVELNSSDFVCEEGCPIDVRSKFSVLDILIPFDDLEDLLYDLGKKYNIDIQLKDIDPKDDEDKL